MRIDRKILRNKRKRKRLNCLNPRKFRSVEACFDGEIINNGSK